MRFIHRFLAGYFVLIVGALLALWTSGVLAHVQRIWIVIGLVITICLGILASVTSGKPTITRE